jgi:hypothetical protein
MKQQDLDKAKDPDLRASLFAIKRASEAARKLAMQTDTCLVIVKDNQLIRITAQELKQEQLNKQEQFNKKFAE